MTSVNESPERSECDEGTNLVATTASSWTRIDFILIAVGTLIKFGDAAEIYLPGVITQEISCELGLSSTQEGILGVFLFLFLAASALIAIPVSKGLGERLTLLVSMYFSIFSTILCSIVPNYYILLLSRAFVGLCVGLNAATIGVYIRKKISTDNHLTFIMFIHGSVAFPLGATYVSIMGYLVLDLVGWRVFLLLASIPLFIPPIILLHGLLTDSSAETDLDHHDVDIENFTSRTIKLSIFQGMSKVAGYGSIILLPSLIRSYKQQNSPPNVGDCSSVITKGSDFLILAAVNGGATLLGRPLCYFLRKIFRFSYLQSFIAVNMALYYGLVLADLGKVTSSVFLWVAVLGFLMQETESWLLMLEPKYYGRRMALGAAVTIASGYVGAVVGVSFAGFLDPFFAVCIIVGVCVVQALVVCAMANDT